MDFIKLTDTGLKVANRQEIYDQLCTFAKTAYGNDISLDEGTPFEVFIGMLSDALSIVNGTAQSVTELFSSKELSGNYLDFIAGQRGIVRKTKRNQRVTMTVTITDSSVPRPFIAPANSITIKDNKGRTWVNTTQLLIQQYKFLLVGESDVENFQGTCEFGLTPLDGYDTDLLYANNDGKGVMSAVPPSNLVYDNFSFINNVNATPAVLETETDAQFRARYDATVYSAGTSTIEALRSNLLKLVDYVRIVENLTNISDVSEKENPYGLDAHSIWVIVGGGSTSPNYNGKDDTVSSDPSDIAIAQTILNYKSLGCGVSVSKDVVNGTIEFEGSSLNTGNFMVEIPMETLIAQIPFTRLIENKVSFKVTLSTSKIDSELRNSVRKQVLLELADYVSGLEPGDIITQVDTINAIHNALSKYEIGEFDFVEDTVSYAVGTKIEIYQRAVFNSEGSSVKFSDEV